MLRTIKQIHTNDPQNIWIETFEIFFGWAVGDTYVIRMMTDYTGIDSSTVENPVVETLNESIESNAVISELDVPFNSIDILV
ncbi:unnamed protein product [Macrosiphum euphorbiae]|uniref:Uncharacterized protein n=1 Tax=Macrosiphum euphorbiae TaxID=13131 RepID=A0AAV0WTP8_9HEMI|nr:unnamed protein product [Macrosiphum euphorbiae]